MLLVNWHKKEEFHNLLKCLKLFVTVFVIVLAYAVFFIVFTILHHMYTYVSVCV